MREPNTERTEATDHGEYGAYIGRDRHSAIRGLRGRIRVVQEPNTERTEATDHGEYGAYIGRDRHSAIRGPSVAASVSCPHHSVQPPSTMMFSPTTCAEASLAR